MYQVRSYSRAERFLYISQAIMFCLDKESAEEERWQEEEREREELEELVARDQWLLAQTRKKRRRPKKKKQVSTEVDEATATGFDERIAHAAPPSNDDTISDEDRLLKNIGRLEDDHHSSKEDTHSEGEGPSNKPLYLKDSQQSDDEGHGPSKFLLSLENGNDSIEDGDASNASTCSDDDVYDRAGVNHDDEMYGHSDDAADPVVEEEDRSREGIRQGKKPARALDRDFQDQVRLAHDLDHLDFDGIDSNDDVSTLDLDRCSGNEGGLPPVFEEVLASRTVAGPTYLHRYPYAHIPVMVPVLAQYDGSDILVSPSETRSVRRASMTLSEFFDFWMGIETGEAFYKPRRHTH